MYLKTNSRVLASKMFVGDDRWDKFMRSTGTAIYWRKANAVHGWFVRELMGGDEDRDGCRVTLNDLARLRGDCVAALGGTLEPEMVATRVEADPVPSRYGNASDEDYMKAWMEWWSRPDHSGEPDVVDIPLPGGGIRVERRFVDVDVMADDSAARDVMPTTRGFFFGSYDYDKWYVDGLCRTVEDIDRLVSNVSVIDGVAYAKGEEGEWELDLRYEASW